MNLRDPIWQVILSAIAIIIPFLFFFIERIRKSLFCEVVAETALVTIGEEVQNEVQVMYKGKTVNNVHIVILRLSNNGNTSILSTDFEQPLQFSFNNEKASILTAKVIEVKPESLRPKIQIYSHGLKVDPLLLNSGDTILIKMLVANYDGSMHFSSRIAGVKDVRLREALLSAEARPQNVSFYLAGVTGVVGIISLAFGLFLASATAIFVGMTALTILSAADWLYAAFTRIFKLRKRN